MKPACKDCRWWDTNRDGTLGTCRAALPVVVTVGDGGMWPTTDPSDWCARFTAPDSGHFADALRRAFAAGRGESGGTWRGIEAEANALMTRTLRDYA